MSGDTVAVLTQLNTAARSTSDDECYAATPTRLFLVRQLGWHCRYMTCAIGFDWLRCRAQPPGGGQLMLLSINSTKPFLIMKMIKCFYKPSTKTNESDYFLVLALRQEKREKIFVYRDTFFAVAPSFFFGLSW